MPLCGEEISIGTAAVGTKGARFIREFVIDSAKGERLISAYSLWVLTDTSNHRIMRPQAYPYDMGWEEPQLAEKVGDIPIPKETLQEEADITTYHLEVRYSHLDLNGHVNNCTYADFVCDALPYHVVATQKIKTLALSFQKEARQGDLLQIISQALSSFLWKVTGVHSRGTSFEALIEFTQ